MQTRLLQSNIDIAHEISNRGRNARICAALFVAAGLFVISQPSLAADGAKSATAQMKSADGTSIGTVKLTETPSGVLLRGELKPVSPGRHGFHIHETGKCDAGTGFKSAGGHLSGGVPHGFMTDGGPHPGDMPNVHVADDKTMAVEVFNPRVSLAGGEGAGASLLDGDGSAIVVHSGADDYESQPSGDAGDRIACGVIEAD